jgi:hypothetical protein
MFDYTIQSKYVYQKGVEFLSVGKFVIIMTMKWHTTFSSNIFSGAIEDVNIYKSITWY